MMRRNPISACEKSDIAARFSPKTAGPTAYRCTPVLPKALRETWRLEASDIQMERVNQALRQRELAWELYRDWAAANAKSAQDVDKAREKALKEATRYAGYPVDEPKPKTRKPLSDLVRYESW